MSLERKLPLHKGRHNPELDVAAVGKTLKQTFGAKNSYRSPYGTKAWNPKLKATVSNVTGAAKLRGLLAKQHDGLLYILCQTGRIVFDPDRGATGRFYETYGGYVQGRNALRCPGTGRFSEVPERVRA